MYNVKIQLVCIFLLFAGIVCSQNTTKTKISDEEKTRIKQNFKDDAFYINDDGVVVYTRKDSKTDSTKTTVNLQPKIQTVESLYIKENNLINDKALSNDSQTASTLNPLDASFTTSGSTTEAPIQFFSKDKDYVNTSVKEEITIIEEKRDITPEVQIGYTVKKTPEKGNITEEDFEIISKPQSGSGYIVKEERESISKSSIQQEIAEKTIIQVEDDEDENIIPLSKKKTTYNSLEEANLAVDQLLVQLKREQKQINKPESKSNSLSSRVVNGYRPNPNKKEETKKEAKDYDVLETDNTNGDFGTEPTYYINGVVVDKSEVLKLRNKNILSRTIKIRNTASGNPNGEIWLEINNNR